MDENSQDLDPFPTTIGKKAQRKLKAQQEQYRGIWYGLGMSGLVGWSVAIPTVLGIVIGLWLDDHLPSRYTDTYSWTLMCLLIGIILGCLNAWYWIEKERKLK